MKKRLAFFTTVLLISCAGFASADETIKVGGSAPLSGPNAYFGVNWLQGAKLYFDTEVNAKGGVKGYKIDFVQFDDKADPREGGTIAQRFCDDEQVKVVIGPMFSGVTLATQEIYSDCGMAQLTGSSNPQITEMGYKNIFMVGPNDYALGEIAAKYSWEELDLTKAAVVHDKQAYGQGVAEIFTKEFTQRGGDIVSSLAVTPADVDFSSVIANIKLKEPEIVFFGAAMPQLALFAKQMVEGGLNARLIVPDTGYTPDLINIAGDASEGVIAAFQAPPDDATADLVAFKELYSKTYAANPGPHSSQGWTQAQIIRDAIEASDEVTRETILEAIRKTDISSLLGRVSFDENGYAGSSGLYLYEVENKAFKLIYGGRN